MASADGWWGQLQLQMAGWSGCGVGAVLGCGGAVVQQLVSVGAVLVGGVVRMVSARRSLV